MHTDADLEEESLKRKIGELASKIYDKGGSSEEEKSPKLKPAVKSSSEISNQKVSQRILSIILLRSLNSTLLSVILLFSYVIMCYFLFVSLKNLNKIVIKKMYVREHR